MRLSIIIPMYNCAIVIERCLDSIEVGPDMEVIVVDDGSNDNGSDVVRHYMEHHSYVRLLRKENGGVSSARNVGIEAATGNYIMFIDADDYLVPGGLERLLCIAEEYNADVLKYSIKSVPNDVSQDVSSIKEKLIRYDVIKGMGKALMGSNVSDYHLVDGLFRRSIIIENHIRLHEDLFLHEDDVFMAEVYVKCSCVVSTSLPLYRYVSNSQHSHTHHPTPERAKKIVDSAFLAVIYRRAAISELHNVQIDQLERIKNMRFVYLCSRHMLSYNYGFREYCDTLEQFRPFGCYPLKYAWLKEVSVFTFKNIVKTFLCNHPRIAWLVYKHSL